MPQTVNQKRLLWPDVLRDVSTLAVVLIHVSSYYVEKVLPYGSFGWFCADLYLALCRFAVPVFVMISGFFFLNPAKTVSVKDIYRKYIWRMLTVWLFWAAVRTAILSVWLGQVPPAGWLQAFWMSLITYWFLPMIMALYAFTPVLRVLTAAQNKKILLYFICLCFTMALCLPVLQGVSSGGWGSFVTLFNTLLKLSLPVFAAHFMFGYYAGTFALGRRAKTWLYVSAALSVLLMAAGGYAFFADKSSRWYYYAMHGSSISPLAFLLGVAVFVLAKDTLEKARFSPRFISAVQRVAYYSLGVYMLHLIAVETLGHFKVFDGVSALPVLTVPLWAVLICAGSAAVIGLLYKIPFFRKYFL